MTKMIDVHMGTQEQTPMMLVAPQARSKMMEALQFKPSEMMKAGWDGGWTQGENVRSYQRGNVGIIEINGLLWTSDDRTAYFMGLTTYESVALEYGRMLDTEGIDGCILAINSPGGLVAGCSELGDMIFNTRDQFPLGVATHVMGMAESGGYWLGSSSHKIFIEPTAMLGSIGAVLGLYKGPAVDEDGGKEVVFISTVSPLKAVDPETKEGASEYQSNVDAVGEVFVETVARNRGVSVETVLSDFGQGGALVGINAVNAGMADGIGSLESVITEMRSAVGGSQITEGTSMSITSQKKVIAANGTQTPAPAAPAAAAVAAPVAAPVAAAPAVVATPAPAAAVVAAVPSIEEERARTSRILAAVAGTGLDAKASEYIAAGTSLAQVNQDLVAHLKTQRPAEVAANQGTLASMAQESGGAAQVANGNGGIGGGDAQAVEKQALNSAWAAGAQTAIAKGGAKKERV